ncbi:MAG: hypothetical protein J2P21_21645 [Chloracidobacterium sp.]|nr:hypothetical protein [Chloracidobacterium sp.]
MTDEMIDQIEQVTGEFSGYSGTRTARLADGTLDEIIKEAVVARLMID